MDDHVIQQEKPAQIVDQVPSLKERLRTFIKEDGITVLIVFILVTGYALLRTQGDTFDSEQALQKALFNGNPTVVEFYSNNCSICLTSKPKVAQLERDLQETASVLKLNIKEPVNQTLAQQWGVRGVPTFFVINPGGEIVYASAGAPDTDAITRAVHDILKNE